MRVVCGHDPDYNPRFLDKRGKDGKFVNQTNTKVVVPKNITTVQYLAWAYGVSYATFKRWKVEEFKWTKHLPKHAGKSVLTDAAFAQTIYTPQRMFLNAKMQEWFMRINGPTLDASTHKQKETIRLALKECGRIFLLQKKFPMKSCPAIITSDNH